MSDLNPVHFGTDGIPVYRCSAIYSCTSALLAWRLGMEGVGAPAWMQERFDQGHGFEPLILERARLRGLALYGFQDEVVALVGKVARLVGHVDAIARPAGAVFDSGATDLTAEQAIGPIVVDAKAFAQSTWDKWCSQGFDAFPYYAWQMSAYSHVYGDIPIAMAIGLKDMEAVERGELVLKDFRLDVFPGPMVPWGEIVAKILKVEALAKQGIDGMPGRCDTPLFPCPFFNQPFHTAVTKGVQIKDGDVVGGDLEALASIVEMRERIRERIKAGEAELATLDEQLRGMVDGVAGNARIAEFSEALSSVSFYRTTRTEMDWDAVESDYPGFDKKKYEHKVEAGKLSIRANKKRA